MIALFKQKSPANIVSLLIFGLLIKLPLFLHSRPPAHTPGDSVLYDALIRWWNLEANLFTSGMIAFMLLYIQSLIITNIVNEYRMTAKASFLPGMAYLLITSLVPEWSFLSAPLIATTLILWAMTKLFELYNASTVNGKIFNIGLLTGLASFFYFPSLFLALLLMMGIMTLRPLRLNELFLVILGLTTPYYFYAIYLFLNDSLLWRNMVPKLFFHIPVLPYSLWLMGSTLFFTIPFLTGSYYVQTNLRKMLIQARKNWSIVLLFLFFTILIGFINSTNIFTSWFLAVAPFAAFHACTYLFPPRRWIVSLLFFAMVAFILVKQYNTTTWM